MPTFFAAPKPFTSDARLVQRNALGSWLQLRPSPRVLVFGDEEGIADAARELGAEHHPELARSEHGTPLVNDLFKRAERLTDASELVYANSDIVFLDDLPVALDRARGEGRPFLLVGRCWNLDVQEPLRFDDPSWQSQLLARLEDSGERRGSEFIDYFAFTRGVFGEIPPFALGRTAFDNWLLWRARSRGALVIDATSVVTAVHQQHGYEHVPGGRDWSYHGVEAQRNWELAGSKHRFYSLRDASHVATPGGLRRKWTSVGRAETRISVLAARGRRLRACVTSRRDAPGRP